VLFTHNKLKELQRKWNSLLGSLLFFANSLLPARKIPCCHK